MDSLSLNFSTDTIVHAAFSRSSTTKHVRHLSFECYRHTMSPDCTCSHHNCEHATQRRAFACVPKGLCSKARCLITDSAGQSFLTSRGPRVRPLQARIMPHVERGGMGDGKRGNCKCEWLPGGSSVVASVCSLHVRVFVFWSECQKQDGDSSRKT